MLYVYWFRKDLRVEDNRGLAEFVKEISKDNKFAFLYIKNDNSYYYFGEKRVVFLRECLNDLKNDLGNYGLKLQIVKGKSTNVFKELIKNHGKINIFCNEQIEPYCIERDIKVKKIIEKDGGSFNSFQDTTIFEFEELKNSEGKYYKVFTPFRNRALEILDETKYSKCKTDLTKVANKNQIALRIELHDWNEGKGIKSKHSFKTKGVHNAEIASQRRTVFKGGRKNGLALLKRFYEKGIEKYREERDFPAKNGTSRLSAHLHFGTIGIREAFRTAYHKLKKATDREKRDGIMTWINELLWREFYYFITFHNPQLSHESFIKEYDKLKWNYDEVEFKQWCRGMTGFPIVDAGMRQLNETGWMHNRLRMITAMFLTKDLFIDWRLGEKYFAEKLIDLDFSNNNGGWQWCASTGVDAQPYFRIFNPYLQSKKFDPEGEFIKKFVPELNDVPVKFIHEPGQMSEAEQNKYNVIIGEDYPEPLVNHSKVKDIVISKFAEATGRNNF